MGASENKVGKFEKADGGTLFLDEVGDMSLRTQSKVLRVLEEQKLEPVGSNQTISVDVRVIAATNKQLEDEILHGKFREDLFYRLNVIPVNLPPLRERIEDVPVLARYFMSEFAAAYGRKPKELGEAALGVMLRYQWPGNVRELRNLIERLMIVVPVERIEPLHLPAELFRASSRMAQQPNATLHEARDAYEREFILRKLEENQWHMTYTAEALGARAAATCTAACGPWELQRKNRAPEQSLLAGHMVELPMPIELPDDLRVVAPVFLHFYIQFEKNLGAQDRLDLFPCLGADAFQGCT